MILVTLSRSLYVNRQSLAAQSLFSLNFCDSSLLSRSPFSFIHVAGAAETMRPAKQIRMALNDLKTVATCQSTLNPESLFVDITFLLVAARGRRRSTDLPSLSGRCARVGSARLFAASAGSREKSASESAILASRLIMNGAHWARRWHLQRKWSAVEAKMSCVNGHTSSKDGINNGIDTRRALPFLFRRLFSFPFCFRLFSF